MFCFGLGSGTYTTCFNDFNDLGLSRSDSNPDLQYAKQIIYNWVTVARPLDIQSDIHIVWVNTKLSYFLKHIRKNLYLSQTGDSLAGSCSLCINGMQFSTYDKDNDNFASVQCAVMFKGGWWHNACHKSSLNGLYGDTAFGQGIVWATWVTASLPLNSSTMKIRRP